MKRYIVSCCLVLILLFSGDQTLAQEQINLFADNANYFLADSLLLSNQISYSSNISVGLQTRQFYNNLSLDKYHENYSLHLDLPISLNLTNNLVGDSYNQLSYLLLENISTAIAYDLNNNFRLELRSRLATQQILFKSEDIAEEEVLGENEFEIFSRLSYTRVVDPMILNSSFIFAYPKKSLALNQSLDFVVNNQINLFSGLTFNLVKQDDDYYEEFIILNAGLSYQKVNSDRIEFEFKAGNGGYNPQLAVNYILSLN